MAAKSRKKRLPRTENKSKILNNLTLDDLLCSICQSILVEPVTLPCTHAFCQHCFNGSIENNALCCPLCRLRIGSWLRNATNRKSLIDTVLWDYIKSKYKNELDIKLKGEDLKLPEEPPVHILSAPGEIRLEYEEELKKLQGERILEEQKHLQENELLIQKLQKEAEEEHLKYLETLKQDEILAKEIHIQNRQVIQNNTKTSGIKKETTLDKFVIKNPPKPETITQKKEYVNEQLTKHDDNKEATNTDMNSNTNVESPIITDDTSNESLSAVGTSSKSEASPSGYGSYLKKFLKNKIRNVKELWNKDNYKKRRTPYQRPKAQTKKSPIKLSKKPTQSLPVSLPYKGVLLKNLQAKGNPEGHHSVDSLHDNYICCFKPVRVYTPIRNTTIYVPRAKRAKPEVSPPIDNDEPSRAQYLQRLCELRNNSVTKKLPSAFVVALKSLQIKQELTTRPPDNDADVNNVKPAKQSSRRRAKSVSSIPKINNERTPKKAKGKDRKVVSDVKRVLRSSTKKSQELLNGVRPNAIEENKLRAVVKDLSSLPTEVKQYDVKLIMKEQLEIEKLIKQEKADLDYALRLDAELNNRRPVRAAAVKRQITMTHYGLRPNKKLRV